MLETSPASGAEDTAIALGISAQLTDLDGSESLEITISDIPDGAVLSAGTVNADGSVTLTGYQLADLTITPPQDFSGEIVLAVAAIATDENGDTATTTVALPVTVEPEVDIPSVTANDASGDEDTAITLDVTVSDGTTSITITDIPEGASLSAGTVNPDGSVTLTPDQLAGLTITPPQDFSGAITLAITANGDTAASTVEQSVTVEAVADTPSLVANDVTGSEDNAIPLDLSASVTDTDGSETLSVTITGMPEGAVLSAGTVNADGSVTLTGDELGGLTITPPQDFSGEIPLEVTATSTEPNGDTATTTDSLTVTVDAVADTPELTASASDGTVENVDSGASGGDTPNTFVDDGGQSHKGTGGDDSFVVGRDLNPNENFQMKQGDDTLKVEGNTSFGNNLNMGPGDDLVILEGDISGNVAVHGASGDDVLSLGKPASSYKFVNFTNNNNNINTQIIDLDTGQTLTVNNIEAIVFGDGTIVGNESIVSDQASQSTQTVYELDISAAATDIDGSETVSVTVSGLPDGAVLSAGTVNDDGSVTLTQDELTGLTLTAPQNNTDDIQLTVTATSVDTNGDTSSSTTELTLTVEPEAETPTLAVTPAVGLEDTEIALEIGAGLVGSVAGDSLTVTVEGLPVGATLSAGTVNDDGSVTLTGDQLVGLTLTPPQDFDGEIPLTVTATVTDSNGEVAEVFAELPVTVTGVLDAPGLTVLPAVGLEDTEIALEIGAGLVGSVAGDSLTVTVEGLPVGATLSAGTVNDDGSVTLTGDQLVGLTLTPPQDFDGEIPLTVTATVTDSNGEVAEVSAELPVTVTGVLDAPGLTVLPAVGLEDTEIALEIGAGLVGSVAGDSLTVTVEGLPVGATLSAGTVNDDGSVTLTGDQLVGLTLTPPQDFDGEIPLEVTATVTNTLGETTSTTASLSVTVTDVIDSDGAAQTVSIDWNWGAHTTVTDFDPATDLVSIGWINADTLEITEVGNDLVIEVLNNNQTTTITDVALSDLTTANFSAMDPSTLAEIETLLNDAAAIAAANVPDAPTLTLVPAIGLEDTAIILDIGSGLAGIATDDVLTVTVDGLPVGANLSDGTVNPDGSVTLSAEQLDGLTILPPPDYVGDIPLSVTVTVTNPLGESQDITATLPVTVTQILDGPALAVLPAIGLEDTEIPLDIATGLVGAVVGDELLVTIAGLPVGASLSSGTVNADGSVTLYAEELTGLTLTPPPDFAGDIPLTVTAEVTNLLGETVTATATLPVTVTDVLDVVVEPVIDLVNPLLVEPVVDLLAELEPDAALDPLVTEIVSDPIDALDPLAAEATTEPVDAIDPLAGPAPETDPAIDPLAALEPAILEEAPLEDALAAPDSADPVEDPLATAPDPLLE